MRSIELWQGHTMIITGSEAVGKSSLVNRWIQRRLLGLQATSENIWKGTAFLDEDVSLLEVREAGPEYNPSEAYRPPDSIIIVFDFNSLGSFNVALRCAEAVLRLPKKPKVVIVIGNKYKTTDAVWEVEHRDEQRLHDLPGIIYYKGSVIDSSAFHVLDHALRTVRNSIQEVATEKRPARVPTYRYLWTRVVNYFPLLRK